MKMVFADAFYFVGLVNRADQYHARIVAAARQLRDEVLTTEWILAEFADALAESSSRRLVPQFIRALEQDPKSESSAPTRIFSIAVCGCMRNVRTRNGPLPIAFPS